MAGFILFLIFLAVFILVLPIVAVSTAKRAEQRANEAHDRIRELEVRLRELRRSSNIAEQRVVLPVKKEKEERAADVASEQQPANPRPAPPLVVPPWEEDDPVRLAVERIQMRKGEVEGDSGDGAGVPAAAREEAAVAAPGGPAFSIEQFLGVKLFAWLGGVALFFGVIFFVKYAFEHNLIPPAMRITLGFAAGLALWCGGLWTRRWEKYRVLTHSLCATGVLVLYGVSFAAHAVYRLPFFNQGFTFTLMAVVTVAAFLTAVRLNALVVAVLGMLGGFITPLLLPQVQDYPLALFGYIALLDIGLLALATRWRWPFLAPAAVAGTILMLVHWTSRFFEAGRYDEGAATLLPTGILLGFCALFLAAAVNKPRATGDSGHIRVGGFAMLLAAMGFGFYFLFHKGITERVWLLYGYVLFVNLGAVVLAAFRPRAGGGVIFLGGLTLLHLMIWTWEMLTPDKLLPALAVYLAFGALHTLWPAVAEKRKVEGSGDGAGAAVEIAPWLPALVIALMAFALLALPGLSLLLWPAILLANALALVVAARRGAVFPVVAAATLTMVTAALWLYRMPEELPALHTLLGVVMGFALFFTTSGLWLAGRLVARGVAGETEPQKLLPLVSAAMPFVLLILMVVRIPLVDPWPVFGAALVLAALMWAVALYGKLPLLHGAALACCLLLQWAWHETGFSPERPQVALGWYLVFYAVTSAVPFVFRRRCDGQAVPWIASALSGVGHFLLVYDVVKRAMSNDWMGLVPAAFAVPALVALAIEWRRADEMDALTTSRLAWFGGVALLFITLVFPIQYDRQWLTIGWALEGAALLWLYRHVPHRGLVATGAVLLCAAFVRLAMNPAVFVEYERSGMVFWNWYLYTYGIVSLALIAGGTLAPRSYPETDPGVDARALCGLLFGMGGILLFLLLNIQIADAYTEPGQRFLAYQFSGNFARDMTYTISWAVFALIVLVIGIFFRARGARYAGIGLLVLTLLKLFLHDLAHIENIFRIAALLCVGVIAFIASFLYQRFVPAERGE